MLLYLYQSCMILTFTLICFLVRCMPGKKEINFAEVRQSRSEYFYVIISILPQLFFCFDTLELI
jgi:hypothetical protein